MEKTSTEKRKLSVIIVIWYYFHKYYFQHAEEGFLLAYFACKNQRVVLHFVVVAVVCFFWFFSCGFFSSHSHGTAHSVYILFITSLVGLPPYGHLPSCRAWRYILCFYISLDLYSIYLFLALKASVHIVSLPSETASFSPSLHWTLQFLSMEWRAGWSII